LLVFSLVYFSSEVNDLFGVSPSTGSFCHVMSFVELRTPPIFLFLPLSQICLESPFRFDHFSLQQCFPGPRVNRAALPGWADLTSTLLPQPLISIRGLSVRHAHEDSTFFSFRKPEPHSLVSSCLCSGCRGARPFVSFFPSEAWRRSPLLSARSCSAFFRPHYFLSNIPVGGSRAFFSSWGPLSF